MKILKPLIPILMLSSLAIPSYADYSKHPEALKFFKEMEKHGFSQKKLKDKFKNVEKRDDILKLMSKPAEGTMTWGRYRNIFIEDKRIEQALSFAKKNKKALENAERKFGVDKEIILAIMAVETRTGNFMGKHRVIDALSTLAFDYPRRSRFFKNELHQFLQLTWDEKIDPFSIKGSYAGAMGYGQFMPSSFQHYAVDFDGDGKRDIWTNPVDAIGSVANYFKKHGWKKNEPVSVDFDYKGRSDIASLVSKKLKPNKTLKDFVAEGLLPRASLDPNEKVTLIKLDDEYKLRLNNFYVITRYNHSKLYASAVYELSKILGEKI